MDGSHVSRAGHDRQQGFTLIEILVVIVILAVVTTLTTIGFGRTTQQQLKGSADTLTLWLQSLTTEALLTSSTLGLWVDGRTLRPLIWDGENWQSLAEPAVFVIDDNLQMSYQTKVKHEPEILTPDHMFLATGQVLPPVSLQVGNDEQQLTIDWPDDETSGKTSP